MPEICTAQRTQEWHDCRKGRITASLAAACLGLDPYCSARKAWRQIVQGEKEDENRHMQWGVQFEAAARLQYEQQTGTIVQTTGFWVHPDHDWLGASPDALIDLDGAAEIKCPQVPPASVPIRHRIQCLIQLAVTERQWCDYYSWGAAQEIDEWGNPQHVVLLSRVYRAGIPNLIVRLKAFFDQYVATGIEPPRKTPKRRKKHVLETS